MKMFFLLQLLCLSLLPAMADNGAFTGTEWADRHADNHRYVNNNMEIMESNTIRLKIGHHTFTATLVDNSSTRALKDLLAKGDLVIRMEDYGNMGKVGPIGTGLPRNDTPTTTGPGDLILYQGRYFVIYYATNSWNFTRLGKIEGATREELLAALGKGDVTVTLSAE